jgi:hypothetical protein
MDMHVELLDTQTQERINGAIYHGVEHWTRAETVIKLKRWARLATLPARISHAGDLLLIDFRPGGATQMVKATFSEDRRA